MSEDEARPLDLSEVAQPRAWDGVALGYADAVSDHLGRYAEEALALAELSRDHVVIDVACGPGTLARRATRMARRVHAVDFSEGMLEELRRRATPEELDRLVIHRADGRALPDADDSFDAAFSMFGLFVFPDRAQGFSELARVLRPAGRAVVATWQPQDAIAAFSIVTRELMSEAGGAEMGAQPLSDPRDLETEMAAADFEVEVHASTHVWTIPSFDDLWASLRRSHVGLEVARRQLPSPRFEALLARLRTGLREELGDGEQTLSMPAWLASGRLPG